MINYKDLKTESGMLKDAVEIKNEVSIKWKDMGRVFARLDANRQAEFITGIMSEFETWPVHDQGSQLIFIEKALGEEACKYIKRKVSLLM